MLDLIFWNFANFSEVILAQKYENKEICIHGDLRTRPFEVGEFFKYQLVAPAGIFPKINENYNFRQIFAFSIIFNKSLQFIKKFWMFTAIFRGKIGQNLEVYIYRGSVAEPPEAGEVIKI